MTRFGQVARSGADPSSLAATLDQSQSLHCYQSLLPLVPLVPQVSTFDSLFERVGRGALLTPLGTGAAKRTDTHPWTTHGAYRTIDNTIRLYTVVYATIRYVRLHRTHDTAPRRTMFFSCAGGAPPAASSTITLLKQVSVSGNPARTKSSDSTAQFRCHRDHSPTSPPLPAPPHLIPSHPIPSRPSPRCPTSLLPLPPSHPTQHHHHSAVMCTRCATCTTRTQRAPREPSQGALPHHPPTAATAKVGRGRGRPRIWCQRASSPTSNHSSFGAR